MEILAQFKIGKPYHSRMEASVLEASYSQDEFKALILPLLNQTANSMVIEAASVVQAARRPAL